MQVVTRSSLPAFETPNAVMRTYASPSSTGTELAVWRAEMRPGAAGPWHHVTEEQVLVVLEGRATVVTRHGAETLERGDSVVLPAGEERRIENRDGGELVTLTCARAGGQAIRDGEDPVPLPWAS